MEEYNLTKRTREKIQELNDKIQLAETLNNVLAVSPFIEIFTSPPTVFTVFHITNTDWELFGKTVQNINKWEMSVLRKFCNDEKLYHAMKNNRADIEFWDKMKNTFK
jgi:hypothetical protein